MKRYLAGVLTGVTISAAVWGIVWTISDRAEPETEAVAEVFVRCLSKDGWAVQADYVGNTGGAIPYVGGGTGVSTVIDGDLLWTTSMDGKNTVPRFLGKLSPAEQAEVRTVIAEYAGDQVWYCWDGREMHRR